MFTDGFCLAAMGVLMVTGVASAVADEWFDFIPEQDNSAGVIGMAGWLGGPIGPGDAVRVKGDRLVTADGRPIKFWGVNLGNRDCAPPPEHGRRWADRYAKYGVNCVRLHKFYPDVTSRQSSTRFDDEMIGNVDAFTHELRRRGMYYGFSWLFGHKLRPEDREHVDHYDEIMAGGGQTNRVLVFIAEDVQDLRIRMLTNLLKRRNPHTGMTYADDPALAFVEYQNEDSIFFYTFGGYNDMSRFPSYKKQFNARFSAWLKKKYGSNEKLVEAWGERAMNQFGGRDEHLDRGNIMVQGNPWFISPEGLRQAAGAGTMRRLLDNAAFLYETQAAFYEKFERAVRNAGYDGPLVTSPWHTPAGLPRYLNLHTDAGEGYIVDRHSYFGGSGGYRPRTGDFRSGTQLDAPGTGLLSQGFMQVDNRPFALSEWNTVFPNRYAPESLTLVAAYGMGLQGWDASYHFASHVNERVRHGQTLGFSRFLHDPRLWNVDVPNQVGIYPAIARMVLRGDVKEAATIGVRRVDIDAALDNVPDWMGEETSEVSAGLGDFKEDRSITEPEALAVGRLAGDFVDRPADHTQPDLARYIDGNTVTSTTGQLRWTVNKGEGAGGFIAIDTPGTQAAVGFHTGEAVKLEHVTITPTKQFAAIYVSALGPEETLATGDAALVTAIARVRNTGMRYSDKGDELLSLGKGPMQCEAVKAELRFARPVRSVELLDHDGLPTGNRLAATDDRRVTIDGARDKTLYYRVDFAK